MKKQLSILVLLVIFLSILVSAQSNESNITIPKINTKDPTPKLDEKLEKKITIPTGLKTITRIGLGIDSNQDINLSELIVVIGLWALIFTVSFNTLKLLPHLGPISAGISAFCLTMIIGSTKGLSLATEKWLGNEDLFIFINGWAFGNLIITILALFVLLVILLYLKEKVRNEIQEDTEERATDRIRAWFRSFRGPRNN